MKRAFSAVLAAMLCMFAFSGCSDVNIGKRNVVDLTESNLWQYVSISEITSFVPAESEASLECNVNGVLDYAFYEDVVLTFEVSYFKPGEVGPAIKNEPVVVALNAAGEAHFVVEYSGLARAVDREGYVKSMAVGELYWFNRTIRLKSVSGKVIYTI